MSGEIPFSEPYRKGSAVKYRMLMDKENMVIQKGKHSERKNDVGKKKGLSVNAKNRIVTTSVQSSSSSVSKTKFPIYFDVNETERSRSRVPKDVCRKDIRARRASKEFEKTTLCSEKIAEPNSFDIRPRHIVSRR